MIVIGQQDLQNLTRRHTYFWLSLRSQMEQAKWSTHHALFSAVNTGRTNNRD